MWRNWFTLFLFCLFFQFVKGQNRAPNPGFENYTSCPYNVSQIDLTPPWSRPTEGTSDYFNQCADALSFVSVPSNQFGNQPARSGTGYAGLYIFFNNMDPAPPVSDSIREYIQAPLTAPLVMGKTYMVEFYVSLSDYSKYATDAIGALLSVSPPQRNDKSVIDRIPQLENDTGRFISDKTGWTKISGCLTADSAYQFITIGNFKNGVNTSVKFVNSIYQEHYSYYFIDDINVQEIQPPDLGNDTVLCLGNSISPDAGPGADYYAWSTGETTRIIHVNSPGVYFVNKYVERCMLTDTLVVAFSDGLPVNLGNDSSLATCIHETIFLDAGCFKGANYFWSTGETAQSIQIHIPGNYQVVVTDTSGCSSMDEIGIWEECPPVLFIPDAFTPNDDGHNDLMRVYSQQVTNIRMMIYNGWGERVFESTDISHGWDGNKNGVKCPMGIYVCVVNYIEDSGGEKVVQQRIALLR